MPGFATESPTFQPAMRLITAITQASPATITTSFDHDYEAGLIVRIFVPSLFGMRQLNQKTGTILSVPADDSFTIDIDTTQYDAFSVPDPEPWYLYEYAMVLPVGEINSSLDQATRNVL